MNRPAIPIAIAVVAGIAAVYVLPPLWLAPLSAGVAICGFIFSIVARLSTRTESPANPIGGILLSMVNLPEQPFAKVKEGWALTMFLSSAAFLVALGLSVMVRAHA